MTVQAAVEPLWPAEPGAARLHRAVQVACAGGGGFAERVDAALNAALSSLAADPRLSRELTVLGDDAQTRAAQRRWVASFAELLRAAAADLPGVSPGRRLREPFLIDDIRFQIGRRVLAGETARLRELRPELLGLVLAFYDEPAPEHKTRPGASALASAKREAQVR